MSQALPDIKWQGIAKGCASLSIPIQEVTNVVEELNNRPRKCWGHRSPNEVLKKMPLRIALEIRIHPFSWQNTNPLFPRFSFRNEFKYGEPGPFGRGDLLQPFVIRCILACQAENSDETLPGAYMAARDPETGEGMRDRQLRDEVVTLFLADHETTASLS
jgi:hypothetical protein